MIYVYEVELQIAERPGKPARVVTRKEYATSVTEACIQAGINLQGDDPGAEARVRHVGPSPELIAMFDKTVGDALERLLKSGRPAKART